MPPPRIRTATCCPCDRQSFCQLVTRGERATELNPALDIEGVLLTMYDERTNLGQQVATDVRQFFKEKVFRTVIPRNVRLGEAPSHGMPVLLYDVKSRGAEAYLALAREVLERAAATAA